VSALRKAPSTVSPGDRSHHVELVAVIRGRERCADGLAHFALERFGVHEPGAGEAAHREVAVDDLVERRSPGIGRTDVLAHPDEIATMLELLYRIERREVHIPAVARIDRPQPLSRDLVP
jgi:hypothetical protein